VGLALPGVTALPPAMVFEQTLSALVGFGSPCQHQVRNPSERQKARDAARQAGCATMFAVLASDQLVP
jgi:hypothetical protein